MSIESNQSTLIEIIEVFPAIKKASSRKHISLRLTRTPDFEELRCE